MSRVRFPLEGKQYSNVLCPEKIISGTAALRVPKEFNNNKEDGKSKMERRLTTPSGTFLTVAPESGGCAGHG